MLGGVAMPMLKTRLFSGAVCEQTVFFARERQDLKTAEPRLRFKNEEEREHHRVQQSKAHHARLINTNYTSKSMYSTLTLDDENEVHTFDEARKLRNLYVRRLKRAYPDTKIHIYMGRGKNTHRIHFHMISDGIPAEVIIGKWGYGTVVRVDYMKAHNYYNGVDHGEDYTGLANYLFEHWTPEQGGHRWKPTRNIVQPEPERATVIKRTYTVDKPPQSPKGYKLVESKSNEFGYLSFKYVLIVDPPKRAKKRKIE